MQCRQPRRLSVDVTGIGVAYRRPLRSSTSEGAYLSRSDPNWFCSSTRGPLRGPRVIAERRVRVARGLLGGPMGEGPCVETAILTH
jgi:hypothetical protein